MGLTLMFRYNRIIVSGNNHYNNPNSIKHHEHVDETHPFKKKEDNKSNKQQTQGQTGAGAGAKEPKDRQNERSNEPRLRWR